MSVVAAAIGVGTAAVGAIASGRASDAASDAAGDDLALQEQMFNRTDDISEKMLGFQAKTIRKNSRANRGYADKAKDRALLESERLYGDGSKRAETTRRQNLAGYRQEMAGGTSRIRHARDKSIQPFQLAGKLGNNALRAYAENLGVGNAPGYNLKMTAGNRYLLDEGSKAIEGSAAGSGGLFSGAAGEELQRHAMGIAAQDRGQQQSELFALGGMGQNAFGTIANLRTGAAGDINALRGGYTDRMAGTRDAFTDRMYGYGTDRANANTNAMDTWGARNIDIGNFQTGAIGTARTNRASLLSGAASNYAFGGGQAIQNRGQAQADGAYGFGNAISNGVNAGFGTYGMMGGQMPGQQPSQPFQPQPTGFGQNMNWNTSRVGY
jgi:hypothetical protein